MRQGTRKGLITVAAAGGVLAVSGGTAFADSGAQGGSANSPGIFSGNTFQAPVNVTVNACGNTVSVVGLLNPASGNGCANFPGGSSGQQGGPSGHQGGQGGSSGHQGGSGAHTQGGHGAHADGSAVNSPGVGSGNQVQVPVDVPVNVCGNSVDVVGIGNAVHGNDCGNDGSPERPGPEKPGPETPDEPERPGTPTEPGTPEQPDEPGPPSETPGGHTPQTPDRGTPDEPGAPAQPAGSRTVVTASKPEPVAHPAPEHRAHAQLAETGGSSQLGVVAPVGAGMLIGGYVLYRRSRAAARR